MRIHGGSLLILFCVGVLPTSAQSNVVAAAPAPSSEFQLTLSLSAPAQALDDPECHVEWAGTLLCHGFDLTLKNVGTHLLHIINNGCTRPLIDLEEQVENITWTAPKFRFSPTSCASGVDSWTELKPGEQITTHSQFHDIWKVTDSLAHGSHIFHDTRIVEYCLDQPQSTCTLPDPKTSKISASSGIVVSNALTLEQPSAQAIRDKAQISGRVLRADNGMPIQGATVELSAASNGVHRILKIKTDRNGEYSFQGVPDDYYIPVASADGFVTSTHMSSTPEDMNPSGSFAMRFPGSMRVTPATAIRRLDFRLTREAVILGSVVDPSGHPAGPGIPVIAEPTDKCPRDESNSKEVETDSQGRFTLNGLAPGQYFVHIHQSFGGYQSRADANGSWYPDTWYGDTSSAQNAVPVLLQLGQQQEIRIKATAQKRYSVIIWLSRPATAQDCQSLTIDGSDTTAFEQKDGSCLYRNLPSGHYTLREFVLGGREALQASTKFDIDDADVTLHITLPGD